MRPSGSGIFLLVGIVLAVAGCQPTCRSVCHKLVNCDEVETPRLAEDECVSQCEVQQKLYDDWQDTELRSSFADLKSCIKDEDCSAIDDGACYDPDLYIW